VTAARDIEVGEEITHSCRFSVNGIVGAYAEKSTTDAGHGMPYAERNEYLMGSWGFNCTCSLCTAPAKQRAASDKRRYRLRDILTEVRTYRGSSNKLPKMLEDTLYMLEMEDMYFQAGSFYAGFAWAYLNSRDFKNARKYGHMADEMAALYKQEEGVAQIMGDFWQVLTAKAGIGMS
jgi:hypothetical protein